MLNHRLRPGFRALAAGFVPETEYATPAQWAQLEATVERAVAGRPAAMRRQLVLLLRAIGLLARLSTGREVARLAPAECTALLQRLAGSRVLLLRRGIWGLRTLVMLGWYTQPGVIAELGYRARPAGWSDRP